MSFLKQKLKIVSLILIFIILIVAGAYFIKNDGRLFQAQGIRCEGRQCNVILIVSDTLSAQHMSVYGYQRETTPFIKSYFEKNGVIFDSASSTASWTMPSFASMFRSKYPSQILLKDLASKKDPNTFVDVLRSQGVEIKGAVDTGQLIKESVANVFDSKEVLGGSGEARFISAGQWLAERDIKNKKPFFMMIHDWTVHDPYTPQKKYQNLFDEPAVYEGDVSHEEIEEVKGNKFQSDAQKEKFVRRYDQEVKEFDDLIKGFVESLSQEILDSSIIMITSDHGEGFDEHGFFYHGAHVYEEFVKIPMLVKFPNNAFAEQRVSTPVSLIDMGPTVLNIFGKKVPESYLGVNFFDLIGDKNRHNERNIISELGSFDLSLGGEVKSFDQLDKKILDRYIFNDRLQLAVRKKNWKLIKSLKGVELFNLENDSFEKNNLIQEWESYPEEDKKIIKELLESIKN